MHARNVLESNLDRWETDMHECGAGPDDWRWLVEMKQRGPSWRLPYEPALCPQGCGQKYHSGWTCLPEGYRSTYTPIDEVC